MLGEECTIRERLRVTFHCQLKKERKRERKRARKSLRGQEPQPPKKIYKTISGHCSGGTVVFSSSILLFSFFLNSSLARLLQLSTSLSLSSTLSSLLFLSLFRLDLSSFLCRFLSLSLLQQNKTNEQQLCSQRRRERRTSERGLTESQGREKEKIQTGLCATTPATRGRKRNERERGKRRKLREESQARKRKECWDLTRT